MCTLSIIREDDSPPVVDELKALFDALPDSELLAALRGPRRRGPKGHAPVVLWRCYVVKYALGLPTTIALIRLLRSNPYIAQACGMPSRQSIPHEATFSRFFTRLTRPTVLPRLKDVSRALTRQCYATIPGFGERVALDSTTIKAWANGNKNRRTDPDGGWSVKKGTQSRHNTFTYGYKLHLLVDCETELPIAGNVSAGNIHDSQRASNVLSEARFAYGRFHPRYLMADAGYSARSFEVLVHRQYRATPIIEPNPSHKKLTEKWALMDRDLRDALYRQRPAVERVFSRLKGQRSLNNITVRRRRKVTVHCYLSLIALQVARLSC